MSSIYKASMCVFISIKKLAVLSYQNNLCPKEKSKPASALLGALSGGVILCVCGKGWVWDVFLRVGSPLVANRFMHFNWRGAGWFDKSTSMCTLESGRSGPNSNTLTTLEKRLALSGPQFSQL